MTKNISCYPQRICNEPRFRELTVLRVERISTGFQCIVLSDDALDGLTSHDFDDHTKIFFPEPGSNSIPSVVTDEGTVWADGVRPLFCDYMPLYDEARHELALNFYTYDGGVASMWMMNVREGDKLTIGGPRGSLAVPEDYAYQAYVCDESGMPALRRRLESLSHLAVCPHVTALVGVQDTTYQNYSAYLDEFTLQRSIDHDEQTVNEYLSRLSVPADDYFIWITGEGKVVEGLYVRFKTEAFGQQRVHAAAHWHQRR